MTDDENMYMTDEENNRWHDGAIAALKGRPCPSDDEHTREGYAYGLEERKVQPVPFDRPEGYYHQAIAD
jgi:hypothetical protein